MAQTDGRGSYVGISWTNMRTFWRAKREGERYMKLKAHHAALAQLKGWTPPPLQRPVRGSVR